MNLNNNNNEVTTSSNNIITASPSSVQSEVCDNCGSSGWCRLYDTQCCNISFGCELYE